ncbi:MAG: MogA/MoaB family molybdenum cofactor biosynthesis protein [Terracidiphilus sp.]|jgi:molybdenum cofactor synthesis domain-containing protein
MLLAVLTISDRCSAGQLVDTAGPAVVALLRGAWPESEIETALLPDEEDAIAAALEEFERKGVALVLTVGGTGLGPRDRTPEATRRVMDREAPGLAEAMRARGSERNVFAWLSRGVAGLRGKMLIVNLPGSKRGAEESLDAILPLLRHGLEVVAGGNRHP